MGALDSYYREAREEARELITLIKVAEESGGDPDGHIIRGQIRQNVRDHTPMWTWLLIEVLARAVAATYDDLDDWSASVLKAVAEEDESGAADAALLVWAACLIGMVLVLAWGWWAA